MSSKETRRDITRNWPGSAQEICAWPTASEAPPAVGWMQGERLPLTGEQGRVFLWTTSLIGQRTNLFLVSGLSRRVRCHVLPALPASAALVPLRPHRRLNIAVGSQRSAHRRPGRLPMIGVRKLTAARLVPLLVLHLAAHARSRRLAPGRPFRRLRTRLHAALSATVARALVVLPAPEVAAALDVNVIAVHVVHPPVVNVVEFPVVIEPV